MLDEPVFRKQGLNVDLPVLSSSVVQFSLSWFSSCFGGSFPVFSIFRFEIC